MATKDQARTVAHVYKKLIDMEGQGWSNLDSHMEMLEYLDDNQLYKEASILLRKHKEASFRPELDVPNPDLLVPMIVESVATILALYEKIGLMDEKCKYILQQYLALHQVKKLKFIARIIY